MLNRIRTSLSSRTATFLAAAVIAASISAASHCVAAEPFRAVLRDGEVREGRLTAIGDALTFKPPGVTAAFPWTDIRRIDATESDAVFSARLPVRRVELAGGDRLTAEFLAADESHIALRLFGRTDVAPLRSRIAGIDTLPGERDVLVSEFLEIDAVWKPSKGGNVPRPLSREIGGGLPANGDWRIETTLPEPIDRGRASFVVRVPETAEVNEAEGSLLVEFQFEASHDAAVLDEQTTTRPPLTIRMKVDARSVAHVGGPGRSDVRNERPLRPGRHQATLLFDRTSARLLRGNEILSSSRRGPGRLVRIVLSSESRPPRDPAASPLALEAVQVQSFEDAAGPMSMNRPTRQDQVRLDDGSDLFGPLGAMSPASIEQTVAGRLMTHPWRDVRSLTFSRSSRERQVMPGDAVKGHIARIGLAPPSDHRPQPTRTPPDSILVAVTAASDDGLEVRHPALGGFVLPWGAIRRIEPRFTGVLLPLDSGIHHLGRETRAEFRRPIPERDGVEGTFSVEASALRGEAFLAVEVVDVEPCGPETPPGSPRLAELRAGFLRTEVHVNDVAVGDLNSGLTYRDSPDGPQRVRMPIPRGVLKAGANRWSLRQRPGRRDADRDECEVGPVSLEIESSGRDDRDHSEGSGSIVTPSGNVTGFEAK